MGWLDGDDHRVWMLSQLILLGGANLWVERGQQPQYSFGHEVVTLAPLSRPCDRLAHHAVAIRTGWNVALGRDGQRTTR